MVFMSRHSLIWLSGAVLVFGVGLTFLALAFESVLTKPITASAADAVNVGPDLSRLGPLVAKTALIAGMILMCAGSRRFLRH